MKWLDGFFALETESDTWRGWDRETASAPTTDGRGRTQQSFSPVRDDCPQDDELAAYSWNESLCVSVCLCVSKD